MEGSYQTIYKIKKKTQLIIYGTQEFILEDGFVLFDP